MWLVGGGFYWTHGRHGLRSGDWWSDLSLSGGWIYGLAGLRVLGFVGMALTVAPFLAGLRLHEYKVGVYEIVGAESTSAPSRSTTAGS